MNKFFKALTAILCAAVMSVPLFAAACNTDDPAGNGGGTGGGTGNEQHEHVDYVSQVKLDLTSNTKKQEVKFRQHVDGDTTHFDIVQNSQLQGCNNAAYFSSEDSPTKGYAKARYMGVNTPESTGRIEPYGDAASKFTKARVSTAKSLIIESNDDKWNIDSTGGRFVLWVWYMPQDGDEYVNLNLEILQNGYAWGSSVYDDDNLYRSACIGALEQAIEEKLVIFSGKPDPDYYYGTAIPVDLKELRLKTEDYANKRVAVKGLVVANFNQTAYIEEIYQDEDGNEVRLGMQVYYSYVIGHVLNVLSVGNYVTVVGVVKYSEYNACYQIADIATYNFMDSENNCEIVEERGLDDAFKPIDLDKFKANTEVNMQIIKTVENEDGEEEESTETIPISYKDSLWAASVSLDNLYVYDSYTTTKEGSSSKGAFTLYCRAADGTEVQIRTEVLKEDEVLVTADRYMNKTISVKGVLELYEGDYQIKVHRPDYIDVKA